jgi:hypothetical protein
MTRSNGSGQITVSDRLDSPAYVSDDEEVRRGQEAIVVTGAGENIAKTLLCYNFSKIAA